MIPLTRDVIQEFDACMPAVHWAGDMSVQEGYEVCTEPGWLMLLLFSIRKSKYALTFDQAISVTRECIKPILRLISDKRLLDSVMWDSATPLELVTADRQYAIERDKYLYEQIRISGIDPQEVIEMYAAKTLSMFLGILEHKDNITVAAKAAHSATDFVVLTLVAEKYPDFIAGSFNAIQTSNPEDVKIFRLAKKIQLCKILRKAAPQPFTVYE